jgi:hypothetical protein
VIGSLGPISKPGATKSKPGATKSKSGATKSKFNIFVFQGLTLESGNRGKFPGTHSHNG